MSFALHPLLTLPADVSMYLRAIIIVAGVASALLTIGFSVVYRDFVAGYGRLVLAGIISYQVSTVYGSTYGLFEDVPLSLSSLLALAGNVIFIVVCLEPNRRKRGRIEQSNEDIKKLLDR